MGRMGKVFPGRVYLSWLWIVSLNVTCRQKFSQFGKKKKILRSRIQHIQHLAKVTLHFLLLLCHQCDRRKESKKATVRLPPTVAKGAVGCINLFILHPGCTPSPSSPFLNGHRHIYDGVALMTGSLPDNPITSHW